MSCSFLAPPPELIVWLPPTPIVIIGEFWHGVSSYRVFFFFPHKRSKGAFVKYWGGKSCELLHNEPWRMNTGNLNIVAQHTHSCVHALNSTTDLLLSDRNHWEHCMGLVALQLIYCTSKQHMSLSTYWPGQINFHFCRNCIIIRVFKQCTQS